MNSELIQRFKIANEREVFENNLFSVSPFCLLVHMQVQNVFVRYIYLSVILPNKSS